MANKNIGLGILAVSLVFVMLLTGCSNGTTSKTTTVVETPPPASSAYSWNDAGGNDYSLIITESSGKSVISSGAYLLIIILSDGTIIESSGIAAGSGGQITLKPKSGTDVIIIISASTVTIESEVEIKCEETGKSFNIPVTNSTVTVQTGTAPILTHLITIDNVDAYYFNNWKPVSMFTENDQLAFGVRVSSPVNAITKFVFIVTDSNGNNLGQEERFHKFGSGNISWSIGWWLPGLYDPGKYSVEVYAVDEKGNKSNSRKVELETNRSGVQAKSAAITGISGLETNRAGIWVFKSIPPYGKEVRNTAIQSGEFSAGSLSVDLVIPWNNTWNHNQSTNPSQPMPSWTGTGDFYIALVPIYGTGQNSYYETDDAWIYTGSGLEPAKVTFNDNDKISLTLPFAEFKPVSEFFDY